MAKIGADLDKRRLFNFYYLKEAIKDCVSVSKRAD